MEFTRRTEIVFIIIFTVVLGTAAIVLPLISTTPNYTAYTPITKKWVLPEVLNEISGIAWLNAKQIVCVQDEVGMLFIYNMTTNTLDNKFRFGKDGDYEGVAIIGDTVFVMRSDGTLFEIIDFLQPTRVVTAYKLPFTAKNNMESLAADVKNNRVLFMTKGQDPSGETHKQLYAFNINTKEFNIEPIFSIDLSDPIFDRLENNNPKRNLLPSEIGIHPETGDIYILEGAVPKLLVLSPAGKPKRLHFLNKRDFYQPEGLTFHTNGKLYISNEGNGGNPTILEVNLK